MDYSVYIDKRTCPGTDVSIEEYVMGLKSLISSLINDLEKFLDKEGRYFGITVHYLHTMREHLSALQLKEDQKDFGKEIMFLYRPLILKAFKKYMKKGLSKADCVICISKDICETILKFENVQPIFGIYEIFDKLYTNIKSPGKEYIYYPLSEIMSECIELGKVGLYRIESFSILEEEKKRKIKSTLDGSGIRIDKSFNNEVSEVSWIEE